jgi:hypothetical protein
MMDEDNKVQVFKTQHNGQLIKYPGMLTSYEVVRGKDAFTEAYIKTQRAKDFHALTRDLEKKECNKVIRARDFVEQVMLMPRTLTGARDTRHVPSQNLMNCSYDTPFSTTMALYKKEYAAIMPVCFSKEKWKPLHGEVISDQSQVTQCRRAMSILKLILLGLETGSDDHGRGLAAVHIPMATKGCIAVSQGRQACSCHLLATFLVRAVAVGKQL